MSSNQPRPRKAPSKMAIIRAVASSTALETGQRVAAVEAKLRAKPTRLRRLTLAR